MLNKPFHDILEICLIDYKYRGGTLTFSQIGIPAGNIRSNLPACLISIKKGSPVEFMILGDPSRLPAASLSVTAYNYYTGKAVKVLTATQQHSKSTFTINLDKGKYILLAVATWLPGKERVTGYAMYNYPIVVVTRGT